jgi:predicted AAA+ superfamily ATPase
MFFAVYVRTYIERDVRDLAQVGDEVKFIQFMNVTASYTGQLLNVASLARDVGINLATLQGNDRAIPITLL